MEPELLTQKRELASRLAEKLIQMTACFIGRKGDGREDGQWGICRFTSPQTSVCVEVKMGSDDDCYIYDVKIVGDNEIVLYSDSFRVGHSETSKDPMIKLIRLVRDLRWKAQADENKARIEAECKALSDLLASL